MNLQAELSYFQTHLATLEGPTLPPPPPPPPPPTPILPPGLSVNDLTTASSLLGSYDLSSLVVEPMVLPSWTMQSPASRPMDPRQFMSFGGARAPTDLPPAQGSSSDFQDLARELLQRANTESGGQGACKNEGPSLPP